MHRELYLFSFGYSSPEGIAWTAAHPGDDLGETSALIFICAPSEAEAETLGCQLAEAFVRALFGDRAYSWRGLNFAYRIEQDPVLRQWATENEVPILETSAGVEACAIQLAEQCQ